MTCIFPAPVRIPPGTEIDLTPIADDRPRRAVETYVRKALRPVVPTRAAGEPWVPKVRPPKHDGRCATCGELVPVTHKSGGGRRRKFCPVHESPKQQAKRLANLIYQNARNAARRAATAAVVA